MQQTRVLIQAQPLHGKCQDKYTLSKTSCIHSETISNSTLKWFACTESDEAAGAVCCLLYFPLQLKDATVDVSNAIV